MTLILRPASVLILALAPILISCVGAEDEAKDEVEAEAEDKVSALADHMHGHLDQISTIKAAVIAGKLEDTREPASWLATHEEPEEVPGAWLPYVEQMRHYAVMAAAAENLLTAAAAVSEIGRTCGDCHRASGFRVAFGYDERPPQDVQNVRTQMQRHLWAADRMWDGLVGPSDVAWKRGTDILAEVQLEASDVTDSDDQQAPVTNLLRRVRSFGEIGSQATSVELRSGLYGEFLSLCATCHGLTSGGPAG
jgi:mono/diheme cytochrome c family protein